MSIIVRLPNGNLVMDATRDPEALSMARWLLRNRQLTGYAKEAAFLATFCRPGFEQTAPVSIGALTDAPCITDGKGAWGFMNYQVEDFLETLAAGKPVEWQKG